MFVLGIAIFVLFAIGLLVSAAGFFIIYKQFNTKHSEKTSNKQAVKTKQLISFYEECKENNITELTSEKNIQKATLIAKKYNIPFTDIKELYKEADSALIEERKKQKEAHLAEMKEEEKVQFNSLMQREHDWAIYGGIASGIAGGAAGAATAMNIQAKNAK